MMRPPPGIEQPHMLGEKVGGSLHSEFMTRTDRNTRQRDLFPFPRFGADPIASKPLSRSCRQRFLSTAHWQNWANDGIAVLNEMGGKDSSTTCTATPSGLQSEVMSRIARAYSDVGKPDPGVVSATGALQALCGSVALYSTEAAPAPYAKELVSWLPRGANPVPLDRILATPTCHGSGAIAAECFAAMKKPRDFDGNNGFGVLTPTLPHGQPCSLCRIHYGT